MKPIPQFSIRMLLGLTAAVAVVFSIVGLGVRGSHWAIGVSAGVGALAILMFFYGLLFGVVWLVTKLPSLRGELEKGHRETGTS